MEMTTDPHHNFMPILPRLRLRAWGLKIFENDTWLFIEAIVRVDGSTS